MWNTRLESVDHGQREDVEAVMLGVVEFSMTNFGDGLLAMNSWPLFVVTNLKT